MARSKDIYGALERYFGALTDCLSKTTIQNNQQQFLLVEKEELNGSRYNKIAPYMLPAAHNDDDDAE